MTARFWSHPCQLAVILHTPVCVLTASSQESEVRG